MLSTKVTEEIRKHSVGPQAAKWLTKALHPPSDITKVAIPDSSWRPGLRVDARPSMILSGIDATSTWDCLVVTPPGDNTFMIAVAAPAGTDFSSSVAVPTAVVKVLQVAKPEDFEVITYDAQSVQWTQTPTIVISNQQLDCAQSAYDAQAFRTTYRSVTVSMTASDLYNGGTLTVGQYDAAYADTGYLVETSSPDSNPGTVHQCLVNFPLTESTMTQGMPGVRTCPAREGYYMPHRLLGPAQPFLLASTAANRDFPVCGSSASSITRLQDPTAASNTTAFQSIARMAQVSSGATSIPFWSQTFSDADATGAAPLWDIGYDNCATGVAIFRNLDPHATLTVQGYVGFEYVLRQNSPFLNFVEESADYDVRALQLYYDLVTRMPMVYPADHNDLGKLLGKIYGALRTTVGVVGPVAVPAIELAARLAASKAATALPAMALARRPSARPALKGPKVPPRRRQNQQRKRR